MKHVLLYVGHMYKPFWTKKIWPGRQEGPGKVKIWHIWVISMGNVHKCIILTFPDPPCQPSQIFWSKMACTLCRCPTYSTTCLMFNSHLWGVFWPSEVKFRGILVLKGDLFYICKNTINVFFSNLAQQNVLIFEIWTLFYVLNHRAKSRKRLSLESNCSFKGGVLSCSFQYFLSKFRKSLLQFVCILFK